MRLDELTAKISQPSDDARKRARDHWDSIAKPIGSLGVLEDDIAQIAAITGSARVSLAKRAVVAFCADNGVVAEGVTQSGQEVTAAVARNMALRRSSVCVMAKVASADVVPVDIGIATPVEGVLDRNVMRGTHDLARGAAMSREQAERAVMVGAELAGSLAHDGYDILLCAEMGIGNTTTSSAIVSVLLGAGPEEVTGRGAGLTDAGLRRKVEVISHAVALTAPDPDDPVDALAKVGGLDIAGLVGLCLGGAAHRVPVVLDGFVSMVAALVAVRISPACRPYLIASHLSAEPASQLVVSALELDPPIRGGLRLGEGTGAVCLLPMLDMALALYNGTTFATTGIDAYERDLS